MTSDIKAYVFLNFERCYVWYFNSKTFLSKNSTFEILLYVTFFSIICIYFRNFILLWISYICNSSFLTYTRTLKYFANGQRKFFDTFKIIIDISNSTTITVFYHKQPLISIVNPFSLNNNRHKIPAQQFWRLTRDFSTTKLLSGEKNGKTIGALSVPSINPALS